MCFSRSSIWAVVRVVVLVVDADWAAASEAADTTEEDAEVSDSSSEKTSKRERDEWIKHIKQDMYNWEHSLSRVSRPLPPLTLLTICMTRFPLIVNSDKSSSKLKLIYSFIRCTILCEWINTGMSQCIALGPFVLKRKKKESLIIQLAAETKVGELCELFKFPAVWDSVHTTRWGRCKSFQDLESVPSRAWLIDNCQKNYRDNWVTEANRSREWPRYRETRKGAFARTGLFSRTR